MKAIFLILGLVLKYGPTLVKVALDIYNQVESDSHQRGQNWSPKAKAERFDVLAYYNGFDPKGKGLENLREKIWQFKNTHKTIITPSVPIGVADMVVKDAEGAEGSSDVTN